MIILRNANSFPPNLEASLELIPTKYLDNAHQHDTVEKLLMDRNSFLLVFACIMNAPNGLSRILGRSKSIKKFRWWPALHQVHVDKYGQPRHFQSKPRQCLRTIELIIVNRYEPGKATSTDAYSITRFVEAPESGPSRW